MNDFAYIDRPDQAEAAARSLRAAPRLAIDTEFVREDTYSGKLCLMQVSDGEHIACVDVLALDGVGPFGELLTDPGIVKVFHASRQDLEILYEQLGSVPAPVWDTQVAAALLTPDAAPLRVYLDWASHDLRDPEQGIDLARDNRELHRRLKTSRHLLFGGEYAGGPGWSSWRMRAEEALEALFPPAVAGAKQR